MRRGRKTDASAKSSTQLFTDNNITTELTTAWRGLAQSKAALRHIENHIEATSGSGVLLDSIADSPKRKSSRKVNSDAGQIDNPGGSSKPRARSQQSPAKSSSRSPLRNATQDSNVRKTSGVEFKEPLVAYREATPPPHTISQLETCNPQSVPGSLPPSLPHSDPVPSQLEGATNKQTVKEMDSTLSSAPESTEVRYLNDQPALNVLKNQDRTFRADFRNSKESSPLASNPGSSRQGESTPSSSPGSASQRLENLRRHQPDDKLEKLKERIRRQRQHLEEAAEREKLQGRLERPVVTSLASKDAGSSSTPTARVRKVAVAPPAPIYKGFNNVETKIRTPDGNVWKEEEFHNLSREIYRDLSRQFAETTCQRQREQRKEKSKERKSPKPVRKIHRLGADSASKPVISPASWRDGQKLVKMVLGPVPKSPREEARSSSADRRSRTASRHYSDADLEPRRSSRQNSRERPQSGFQTKPRTPEETPGVNTGLLSADIRGILDDLQLDCKVSEKEQRACKSSRGRTSSRRGRPSQTRTPVSAWGANPCPRTSRSASPGTRRPDSSGVADRGHKKRHYDADSVRQYIARQQEERKKRQAEQRRAQMEEVERKTLRLKELYKKQREVAKPAALSAEASVAPVQKRLQETYTKLMLEEAQLGEEAMQEPDDRSTQMMPMYQPSGESDKENKRLEALQSPSSSDKSLNDLAPPPLSRNDLDAEVATFLPPDRSNAAAHHMTGPSSHAAASSNEHLLSQLLRLEAAVAASNMKHAVPPASSAKSQSKMSRIEALKATAASLSNRIESEARKLAGQGINYGATTSLDVDTVLAPGTSNGVHGWKGTVPYASESPASPRTQRVLSSTGHRSYNDDALPGAGNLHDFRESKEITHNGLTNLDRLSPDLEKSAFNSYIHKRRIAGGLEMDDRTNNVAPQFNDEENFHDSSAGSISEGPLLSEGSFSQDEISPPRHPKPDYLKAADHRASQKRDNQRLLEFQREAAMSSALSPPQLENSKAHWEELNKGSPLSVINIFTKNLQVNERNVEPNSPRSSSLHSDNGHGSPAVYEEDFVSSQSSKASEQLKRGTNSSSTKNHFDELMRRYPYEKGLGGSASHSPHRSSGSTSSPSRHSTKQRRIVSDQSDATLVGEQRSSCSTPSEALSSDARKRGTDRSSADAQRVRSHDTSRENKGHSPERSGLSSYSGSPDYSSQLRTISSNEAVRRGRLPTNNPGTSVSNGDLQYSPAALQQRMAAELQYLESMQDSIRQLGDVERLMGVSMAQQESASLAQMLKVKQQRHERELYELKIKAEREALETKLQLEENRQQVARAHIELQEGLAASQKEALEGLQESTCKMMSQQAEAAQHTADAARHIKEMTELARSQIVGTLITPGSDQQDQQRTKKQEDKSDSDSFHSEVLSRRSGSEVPLSSMNSLSHSDSYRGTHLSGATSSSSRRSSSRHREPAKKDAERRRTVGAERTSDGDAVSSSIEENIPGATNESLCSDSVPSVADEKGRESTSVATEYSLKLDESMTEDEIEERSFRSVLPSESHRRGTIEKKSHHLDESEDDGGSHNATRVTGTASQNNHKTPDVHITFSGGQDSFSQFTMDMVRQYMKDEEVRLQHQSSLLHLRQKAVKEKTRTELAWLELQKKRLRDKGEDDKMPPIRKKQRGLLMKLQQEQAEIKRLQEANRAARKERQLLLKQQQEIERMRNSTLRLKERLKCAEGESRPEAPLLEHVDSEAASSNVSLAEDVRSPSPSHSVSGSETSSIMQKLKKMRSHMDEKHCSPVHLFFSVFTAQHWASLSVCLPNLHPKIQLFIYKQLVRFLTKREQQLMQRRHHAEELLQWKQRLDQEEAEVRRMEREALAVWEQKRLLEKDLNKSEVEIPESASQPDSQQSSESKTDLENEGNRSTTPDSIVHTEGKWKPGSASSVPETPLTSAQSSPANDSQDFTSASQIHSRKSSPHKGSHSHAASPANTPLRSISQTPNEVVHPPDNISDQSDIEGRIKALKEELRGRKLMAVQLKKEQKKRHKERLKAKEASLLKQLETYNNFIEKTKAELCKESDSTPESLQVQEESSAKSPSNRPETVKSSEEINESGDYNSFHEEDRDRSLHEDWSLEERAASPEPSAERRQQSESEEPASDVQEDPELKSKPEDELSQHLFKLSQEEEPPKPDQAVSALEQSQRMEHDDAQREAVSDISVHSAADDLGSVSSKRSESLKDAEASPRADRYHDDFESADSSSGKDHSSKPDSPSEIRRSEKDGQDSVGEEEISEELSQHPLESEESHSSGRLLDIYQVNSSHAPPTPPQQEGDEMPSFSIGDRVLVGSVQPGTLRFKGATSFANGFWAGVELDKSEGSNNGTYDGVVYFECRERHGIFAPPDKITHFPERFEPYNDTTEDEDSFFDDFSNDKKNKPSGDSSERQRDQKSENIQSVCEESGSENRNVSHEKKHSHLTSPHTDESGHPVTNGNIILDFEDPPLIISDVERDDKTRNKDVSEPFIPNDLKTEIKNDTADQKKKQSVDTFADELVKDFLEQTVKQLSEIKKVKEQKIVAANLKHEENKQEDEWSSPVEQKDGLPFFLPAEQEELSSPELCNKSQESPVLGASGQEELAKRLAELELSRELLEDQGDDQDWFDEDFGLSSRRKQILKEKEEAANLGGELPSSVGRAMGATSSLGGEGKTPLRPELPQPPKLPEQPAMVVPHSATEVGKMVHAATREIWEACNLGKAGTLMDSQMPNPKPSLEYLSEESHKQEQEAVSIRSYKQAVFDLTWEILQQIYSEDPVTDQPQWVKPRQVKSSSIYQVKTSGDINRIQEFVTTEVLKLFGLKQDQNQKTDWQKMLKFGRKKRDRVDQILVQELQEEEAQWVNYDEDEFSVKMQLADSIFESLLKDTADTFTQIFEKRRAVE
ncbi:centrosome-associated protein 350 isoform X5 [Oryzias melastigma]|uniref:centrosome-associated protein 350 isoform X5 n=1 Tax=Oryzias melastigma TaxID=30732 RepID=UPI000CF8369B|nr:centrosome-associated protein 350 isoform X5 [Oryzias melastigma]